MVDPADVVEKLRPLRPPPSDGTAEILVMTAAGCAAAAIVFAATRHWLAKRRPLRRAALVALAASRDLPPPERLAAQARLLRDAANALDSGARGLRGEEWLARLDAVFATRLFSAGAGRVFGDALYQPRADDPADALDPEIARILARIRH